VNTARGQVHSIEQRPTANTRRATAMTPSTRALLAALGAAAADLRPACEKMMLVRLCDIKALTDVTARDTAAALETLRHRHNAQAKATELVKACVQVQRWVDRLATAPGSPDMNVYRALYAVLLRRLVIDGVTLAAETLEVCRRAATDAVNSRTSPGLIVGLTSHNSGAPDEAATAER